MRRKLIGTMLLASVFLGCWASVADDCQGGPLRDWLRRRRITLYRPWRRAAFYPAATYAQPVTVMSPVTAQPQQVVLRYAPRTVYRTTWLKVPVTYYRPATGIDPSTGAAITWAQPCTTYRWRLRRVPHTTYRPVWGQAVVASPSPCSCNPLMAPAAPMTTMPMTTSPPPQQPYYTPPAGPTPAAPGGAGTGGAAADRQPFIPPGQTPPGDGLEEEQNNGGLGSRLVPIRPNVPASTGRQDGLRPVPDPDAQDPHDAPQLLNPRDRTAYNVRQAWAYAPISWPTSATVPAQHAELSKPQPSKPVQRVEPTGQWDDSGWYEVR